MFYICNAKLTDENPDNAIFNVFATHKRNDDAIWETIMSLTGDNADHCRNIIKSLSSKQNCLFIYHTQKGVLAKIGDFTELKTDLLDYHCNPSTLRAVDALEDGENIWITFNQETSDGLRETFSDVEWETIETSN